MCRCTCRPDRSTAADWFRRPTTPAKTNLSATDGRLSNGIRAVRERYQRLLAALAQKFDGRVYGINLPESAIDIDIKNDKTGFTCEKYFAAELENVAFARKAFVKSHVVQYVNFWPCEWNNDKKFMSRAFEFAHANGIGLGGPDIVPYKKGQMKNAYPFFHQYKGKLKLVAMAVQEPTLTYTNPETKSRSRATEFVAFAEDYLGVDIIFWATASPVAQARNPQRTPRR